MNLFKDSIEEHHMSKMKKKIQLENFKRKIEDNEVPCEKILKKYRSTYPNTRLFEEKIEWKHDGDLHMLYDNEAKQPRFVISNTTEPILIPPNGCTNVKRFNYKKEQWVPNSTPALVPGAILSIFRHLNGWEILPCRLVCKKWREIATKEVALWKLNNVPRFARKLWPNSSPFKIYVQHMFINAPDDKVVNFFFKEPAFFHHICQLLLGGGGHYQLKRSSNGTKLIVGRFMIVKQSALLICDEKSRVSIQVFLEAYRQSLLK